jgi:hypothetical protein
VCGFVQLILVSHIRTLSLLSFLPPYTLHALLAATYDLSFLLTCIQIVILDVLYRLSRCNLSYLRIVCSGVFGDVLAHIPKLLMRIGSCRYFTRRAWERSTAGVGTEVVGKRKVGKEVKRKENIVQRGERVKLMKALVKIIVAVKDLVFVVIGGREGKMSEVHGEIEKHRKVWVRLEFRSLRV